MHEGSDRAVIDPQAAMFGQFRDEPAQDEVARVAALDQSVAISAGIAFGLCLVKPGHPEIGISG